MSHFSEQYFFKLNFIDSSSCTVRGTLGYDGAGPFIDVQDLLAAKGNPLSYGQQVKTFLTNILNDPEQFSATVIRLDSKILIYQYLPVNLI